MKMLTILGLMIFLVSNSYANQCYVQESSRNTYLVIIEDGPIIGEYKTLKEAANAVKVAIGQKLCE